MSRGIKLFKVPSQYASLSVVTSSGGAQRGDIVIVDSQTGYDGKMKVYQYTSKTEYSEITSGEYQFTDNTLVPNVTLLRKAHQDDYRTLLNTLKGISTNKFGDTLSGRFDLLNAKIQWDGTSKYALYMNSVSKILSIDFSDSIYFNYIDANFAIVKRILTMSSGGINVNGQLNVTAATQLNTTLNVTGATQLGDTLNVTGKSILHDTEVTTFHADTFTSVDSTTLVTNLNADLFDGHHWSEISSVKSDTSGSADDSHKLDGHHWSEISSVKVDNAIYADSSGTAGTASYASDATVSWTRVVNGLGYAPNREIVILYGSVGSGTAYYHIPKPAGTIGMIGFISSIRKIAFTGDVNGDDRIWCDWEHDGYNGVNIRAFNTEQSESYVNFFGIWLK